VSQGLKNMEPAERNAAIARRVRSKDHGWGYWGAIDAQDSISQARKAKIKADETAISEAILTEVPGNIPAQVSEAVQVDVITLSDVAYSGDDGREAHDDRMEKLGAPGYTEILSQASPEAQEFVDEHVTGQDSIGV